MSIHTRALQHDDLPALGDLLNGIFRLTANVRDQFVLDDFPLVFTESNYRNCRALFEDGRLVSHAGIFACELIVCGVRLKTAVIILVATEPSFRQRGHAARLMMELEEQMRDEQYDLGVLWTSVPDFYGRLNWEVVRPRGWYLADLRDETDRLTRAAADAETRDPHTIERYDQSRHLEGIICVHDREPVRVARSHEEYAQLLRLPKMTVWVLERRGAVAAYAVIGQAINKQGLLEYGGTPDDLFQLARHALKNQRLNRPLPWLLFPGQVELTRRLRAAGDDLLPLECSKGKGVEMILPINDERLPAGLRDELFFWGLDFT